MSKSPYSTSITPNGNIIISTTSSDKKTNTIKRDGITTITKYTNNSNSYGQILLSKDITMPSEILGSGDN